MAVYRPGDPGPSPPHPELPTLQPAAIPPLPLPPSHSLSRRAALTLHAFSATHLAEVSQLHQTDESTVTFSGVFPAELPRSLLLRPLHPEWAGETSKPRTGCAPGSCPDQEKRLLHPRLQPRVEGECADHLGTVARPVNPAGQPCRHPPLDPPGSRFPAARGRVGHCHFQGQSTSVRTVVHSVHGPA